MIGIETGTEAGTVFETDSGTRTTQVLAHGSVPARTETWTKAASDQKLEKILG